jgi:hypothetical protein
VINHTAQKSSTINKPLFEKSSDGMDSFVDFIERSRVRPTPRGDLVATFKTLISARAFPKITSWSDLYRFMAARGSSDATIGEARRLWNEFKKAPATCGREKSQPAIVPPIAEHRRKENYG